MKRLLGFSAIFVLLIGILSVSALAQTLQQGSVERVHVLTLKEMVYAYNAYKPEIKSKEGFMDLLQSLHGYSTKELMRNGTVSKVVANGSELVLAIKELHLHSKLDVKKIDHISLTRNTDSSIRFDLVFDKPVSSGANYIVANIKLHFPKESSWLVESMGDTFILKNIEGKPNVTASVLFGLFGFQANNIREAGVFQYASNEKDKGIFGYAIGETKTDRNYFAGLDVEKLSVGSLRYKGTKKAWPEEIPSFSGLKTLVQSATLAKA